MKYFIVAILMVAASTANAGQNRGSIQHEVICAEGYKFLLTYNINQLAPIPTVVQIFTAGTASDYPSQPMKCDK